MNRFRVAGWLTAALVAVVIWVSPVRAQTASWPAKPVSVIVGFAAGGPTDVVARVVAKALGEELGVPVIVENRPGAGATVAASYVASQPADGHTMLLVVPGMTAAESLFPGRKYDLTKDFSGVSLIGTTANWLLVSESSQLRSVADIINKAKLAPGKLSYAHGATGGLSHLLAEWLKTVTGTDILQVAYRGNGPALIDVASGRVDMMFDQPIGSENLVNAGRVRPVAVTSAERLDAYPDVPTMAEAGVPDFVALVWYGFALRAGTPEHVKRSMHEALLRAMTHGEVKEGLIRAGVTPHVTRPGELDAMIRTEVARWRGVIEKNGITN